MQQKGEKKMPSLIFSRYGSPEEIELNFDDVEVLSVQEVRETVSSTMGVPLEELSKYLPHW